MITILLDQWNMVVIQIGSQGQVSWYEQFGRQKTVQDKGCEKSGHMAPFETFMNEEYGKPDIPLFSFLGNRFNILFLNGADIFYSYEKLVDFFKKTNLDKLLSPVHYDLGVLGYCLECRALGLIEKLVTRPPWKIISKEKHVLNMSTHYQDLLSFFWIVCRWCFCFYERW